MAWGRRCDLGCESWPDDDRYKKCPGCGEETDRFSNLKPLNVSEANHAEFEYLYAVYDAAADPSRLRSDGPNAAGRYRDVGHHPEPSPRASS